MRRITTERIKDMNNNRTAGTGGGIGIAGILTIIFVVLKLVGVISWPWICVLSPIWIMALLVIGAIVIAVIVGHFFLK